MASNTPPGATVLRRALVPGIQSTEAWYPRRVAVPLHEHQDPFFTYVVAGEFTERSGSSVRECRRGTVVVRPRPESHTNSVGSADVRCFNVEVANTLWTELTDRAGSPMPTRSLAVTNDAEWAAFGMWREFHRADATSPLALEESLVGLLALLYADVNRAGDLGRRWIDRAAEHIAGNLVPTPSLRDVAREVGVHPMHLAKAFRRRFGCSMGEFVRRRRIAWACEELHRDTGTIATIAIRTGFADHAHFTRTFRRVTGSTPTWYRRHLLGQFRQ